jgi:hypothetical protein
MESNCFVGISFRGQQRVRFSLREKRALTEAAWAASLFRCRFLFIRSGNGKTSEITLCAPESLLDIYSRMLSQMSTGDKEH